MTITSSLTTPDSQASKCSLLWLMLSLFTFSTFAHEPSHIDQPTQINIKSAMSVQNDSIVDQDQAWLIPGVNLGNEATPKTKGAAIDDIQINARLNLDDGYYLASKIGFHQHTSSDASSELGGELKLENFWLGKYIRFESGILRLDAGQMSSRVTPTANHHPSQDNFAITPLLADAFFGGHHKDVGISANWFMAPISFDAHMKSDTQESLGFAKIAFGIEAFNGGAWPYSSSDGSISLFAKYHGELYSLKTDAGFWYSTGKAVNRSDTRYSSDHHNSINISVPDGTFAGDLNTYGAYMELFQPLYSNNSNSLSWQANWEWIQMKQDGVFSGATESAQMKQTLDGYSVLIGLTLDNGLQQHKLFGQYEMLVVNNGFTNTTDSFLAEQNLTNNGIEPNRIKIGYHWRWNKDFTLRVETLFDKTQIDSDNINGGGIDGDNASQTEQIWSLGLIWQHNLL